MLSDEHALYFGQAITPGKDQTTSRDANGGNATNTPSTQAAPTGATTGNANRRGITGDPSLQAVPTGTSE